MRIGGGVVTKCVAQLASREALRPVYEIELRFVETGKSNSNGEDPTLMRHARQGKKNGQGKSEGKVKDPEPRGKLGHPADVCFSVMTRHFSSSIAPIGGTSRDCARVNPEVIPRDLIVHYLRLADHSEGIA